MAMLENLKLVKKEIDTRLAEEYVNKIKECTWPESGNFFIEEESSKITKLSSLSGVTDFLKNQSNDKKDLGNEIAKKIEDNVEMFVQLEYLVRGTDPRDVRDGHIKLMCQILRCTSALWNINLWNHIYFSKSTHLYNLAAAVAGSMYGCEGSTAVVAVESKELMPLCKYFAQLCWDAGFNLPIIYTNPDSIDELYFFNLWREPAGNSGCTGVIAERSDLDSAIDAFINSSVTAPWRLTQIFVQESIFEDFKESLAARALEAADGDLVVGDKTFLIECLQGGRQGISVHAYRTTKELLMLIKSPYLSVWAAETALSNEISLRSPSYTVWVNEYGSFHGPPRSALSVYDQSCHVSPSSKLPSWQALKTVERFDILVAAIKASGDEVVRHHLSEFKRERSRDFVEVTDRTVCFGIQMPLGMVQIDRSDKVIMLVLNVLCDGNGVTLNGAPWVFADELSEIGVPISTCHIKRGANPMILERMKVIRTNYGTIFAN